MGIDEEALELHKKKKGKIGIRSKVQILSRHDLSLAYTPGVAAVSNKIAEDKSRVYDYTMKSNSVAVVSDGSAVLGLGNIGPEAALPVMEGKALLFKEFSDIDAFPICLATQDENEIVNIIRNIAPVFGGINLEDISAPRCFFIEQSLQDIGIPVFHDDQHGTAIVVLSALINAARAVGKRLEEMKVVISGAGAAGTAVAKLLLCIGIDKRICTSVREIIICDSKGIIHKDRKDLPRHKKELAGVTNTENIKGTLSDALFGADAFVGVSVGGIVTKEMISKMNDKPIVFAMANPIPEISYEEAVKVAAVVGTGRSDYPNQINNVLAFPGVFRGALDAKAGRIDDKMKLAAAYALAKYAEKNNKIVPDSLDKNVVPTVAEAVKKAAIENGLARWW